MGRRIKILTLLFLFCSIVCKANDNEHYRNFILKYCIVSQKNNIITSKVEETLAMVDNRSAKKIFKNPTKWLYKNHFHFKNEKILDIRFIQLIEYVDFNDVKKYINK